MRVPDECLRGARLVPHSLHAPERPELGRLAGADLRHSLFGMAAQQVTNICGDCEIEAVRAVDCAAADWKTTLAESLYKRRREMEELIHCEEWSVAARGRRSRLRVRYFQSVNDAFRADVCPATLRDCLWDLLANRHLR